MGLSSQEFKSIDAIIDKVCINSFDVIQAMVYIGTYQSNMFFNLGQGYEEIDLEEDSSLDIAYTNDQTHEMLLITDNDLRIYKYRDKEVYKKDAKILKNYSERIKLRGN